MSKVIKVKDYIEARKRDKIKTILIEKLFQPSEIFILRDDGSLEKLVEDLGKTPEGYILVTNPSMTSQYVEQGNGQLKPVDEVPEGIIPYDFKENIAIYMKY